MPAAGSLSCVRLIAHHTVAELQLKETVCDIVVVLIPILVMLCKRLAWCEWRQANILFVMGGQLGFWG